MMLLRMAYMISSAREWKSSLSMMLARWASAVLTLMLRRVATSLLLLPSARSWRISRSRGVRREGGGLGLSGGLGGGGASEARGGEEGVWWRGAVGRGRRARGG